MTPAATAEPMTPATFGPIACIRSILKKEILTQLSLEPSLIPFYIERLVKDNLHIRISRSQFEPSFYLRIL